MLKTDSFQRYQISWATFQGHLGTVVHKTSKIFPFDGMMQPQKHVSVYDKYDTVRKFGIRRDCKATHGAKRDKVYIKGLMHSFSPIVGK